MSVSDLLKHPFIANINQEDGKSQFVELLKKHNGAKFDPIQEMNKSK